MASLSRASSIIQMPEKNDQLNTERVLVKNIDSLFEDLEAEKKTEDISKPVESPVTEVISKPVESSVEKEVACWKCNGSKKNKKGKQCKKCDGTGLIQ